MQPINLALVILLAGCGRIFSLPLVQGKVLSQNGQAIPGAVISDGERSTCTDEDGHFELNTSAKGLKVRKPGYMVGEFLTSGSELTLQKNVASISVAWDLRWSENQTAGIQSALATAGFKVQAFNDKLPDADVWVLPCPRQFPTAAIAEALNWVRQGKNLVVFGEWGGYPAFDQSGVNSLLANTGISFSGSTIRAYDAKDQEAPEWVLVNGFTSRSLLTDVYRGLQVFTAGSLAVESPGRILAQSEGGSFRIMGFDKGNQIMAAYAPIGYGKITVWSDYSFITDNDSKGQGTPNWQTLDNPKIITNTLKW